jgi:hypothetical protein
MRTGVAGSGACVAIPVAAAGGSWHEFSAENWIVLSAAKWSQLLPAGKVAAKQSWTVPAPVAVKLAGWVYPQNEEKTG